MKTRILAVVLVLLATMTGAPSAWAVVRLSQIATIEGETPVRLSGVGLVVGLKGTGDGGNAQTMAAFRKYLESVNQRVEKTEDLAKHSNNIAMVTVTAEVPPTGIGRGQLLNCHLSAMFGCKSLAGGTLIQCPLVGEIPGRDEVLALASGNNIVVEDKDNPTNGLLARRAKMLVGVTVRRLHKPGELRVLLNPERATAELAQEVARSINEKFYVDAAQKEIAEALSDIEIAVQIPRQYENPAPFIAQLKQVTIKDTSRPIVIINEKTGTIVVSDDVELKPTAFSHKNLSVSVTEAFVGLQEAGKTKTPQRLTDLVETLNRLKVPPTEIISVLRVLHASGSLQAELIEK